VSYSYSQIDPTAFDADKPCFVPGNALYGAEIVKWTPGPYDWSDSSVEPAYYAIDGQTHKYTDHNFVGDPGQDLSLYFSFVSNPISFDLGAIYLSQANGNSSTFDISIANDSAGSPASWTVIYSTTWSTTATSISVRFQNVYAHTKINDVDYVRVRWQGMNSSPRVTEVFLGERVQIGTAPQRPHDTTALQSSLVDAPTYRTDVGDVDFAGKYLNRLQFLAANYEDKYSVNNHTALRQAWEQSEWGAKTVLYFPNPSTLPSTFHLCNIVNQPDFRLVGPFHSNPTLVLRGVD